MSRKGLAVGVAVLIATASGGAVVVSTAAADHATSGVISDTSQPKVNANTEPAPGDVEPPAELADMKPHATIDGKIQPKPLVDGEVVDELGRRDDGSCGPSGHDYGVARLSDGGPSVSVGFAIDRDRCTIVAHFDPKEG